MFVTCSTLCFAREPLETALRQIAELEFDKFELALVEDGIHLHPSEAGDHPEAALQRLRSGPSLIPSSLHIDFGAVDWSQPAIRKRFDGLCRLAKSLSVAVITMHAAPRETPLSDEIQRLTSLVNLTSREGLVLAILTHAETVTADPKAALSSARACPAWRSRSTPAITSRVPMATLITTHSSRSSRTFTCAIRAQDPASFR